MRRIRIFFLLETLLIALAITPAEAVPVQGPDGYFYEVVPTPVTWPPPPAAPRARRAGPRRAGRPRGGPRGRRRIRACPAIWRSSRRRRWIPSSPDWRRSDGS